VAPTMLRPICLELEAVRGGRRSRVTMPSVPTPAQGFPAPQSQKCTMLPSRRVRLGPCEHSGRPYDPHPPSAGRNQ
jgi:hypothetical protein